MTALLGSVAGARRLTVLAAVVAALSVLFLPSPAAGQEQLDAAVGCGGVAVTGAGFHERAVLLSATDLRSGRALAHPATVLVSPDGSFRAWLPVRPGPPGAVVVSAWRRSGATVALAIRALARRPCLGAGPRRPRELPLTGGPHPGLLALGVGLLTVGFVLLRCGSAGAGSPGSAPGTSDGRPAAR